LVVTQDATGVKRKTLITIMSITVHSNPIDFSCYPMDMKFIVGLGEPVRALITAERLLISVLGSQPIPNPCPIYHL